MKEDAAEISNKEKDAKRTNILDAAITEFCKGYKDGSTYSIIKAAGVSKGLLFYHFETKKDLFLQTYDYAVELVMNDFYNLMNLEQRDILERWKQGALLKMDLIRVHPKIFDFLSQAVLTNDEEVKEEIKERYISLANTTIPKVYDNIDRSLFRDDIDIDAAIKVILNTIEEYARSETKYAQNEADKGKSTGDYYAEYGRILSDLDRYILLFRRCFYK